MKSGKRDLRALFFQYSCHAKFWILRYLSHAKFKFTSYGGGEGVLCTIITSNHDIATQKWKRTNFLPHWNLNRGPLEPKACVLPMNNAEPFWISLFFLRLRCWGYSNPADWEPEPDLQTHGPVPAHLPENEEQLLTGNDDVQLFPEVTNKTWPKQENIKINVQWGSE